MHEYSTQSQAAGNHQINTTRRMAGDEIAAFPTKDGTSRRCHTTRGLLPTGFFLASLYGALRFLYYGIMLTQSPFRRRARLLACETGNVHDDATRFRIAGLLLS